MSAQTFLPGFSSAVWKPVQKEKQVNTFSSLTGFELLTSLNKWLIAYTKDELEHEAFVLQRNDEDLFRKRRVIGADIFSSTNNNTTGLRNLPNPRLSFDFAYFYLTELELSS